MDDIRIAFAKVHDVPAGMFSFNSTGACPVCEGKGELKPDMAFADPIALPCEACRGTRYSAEARQYTVKGMNIVDVLGLTVSEALEFFESNKIRKKVQTLTDVGVDYLTLGQPTSTLSGGEAQRIKLASELHKEGKLYVLDEPTSGLHSADIKKLHLELIAESDWVIALESEGGKNGGEVWYSGPIKEFIHHTESYTACYLKKQVQHQK